MDIYEEVMSVWAWTCRDASKACAYESASHSSPHRTFHSRAFGWGSHADAPTCGVNESAWPRHKWTTSPCHERTASPCHGPTKAPPIICKRFCQNLNCTTVLFLKVNVTILRSYRIAVSCPMKRLSEISSLKLSAWCQKYRSGLWVLWKSAKTLGPYSMDFAYWRLIDRVQSCSY